MNTQLLHLKDFSKSDKKEMKEKFGEGNFHLIWVMSMYLDEPDTMQLGIDCLTDQPNDKKLDFVYVDTDSRRLVFAQGYFTQKTGATAPANKASDLNTAAAWLISGDLNKVPNDIADSIRECRKAIDNLEVDQIEFVYVHNLTQSKFVSDELETVAKHFQKQLRRKEIQVLSKEIGLEECERLYVARESGILIKDEINIPSKIAFEESGPDWKSGILSLPAAWLYSQYEKYGQDLFSANYRGFLGVSKRKKINAAMKQTAESNPEDFWVFNNGITLLTLDYKPRKRLAETTITGCSIINGAQTTGSISQIDPKKHDLSKVRVLARVVACGDQSKVRDIVRYNNTQNEITTWDQYSNTETQKRIADEFKALSHKYSLKRGFGQSISGLGIEVVAQPLLAFSGHLEDASRGKNTIFDRRSAYTRAFEGKSARHILFVYTLATAIDQIRLELKDLNSKNELTKAKEKQLRIARSVRFKYFFMAIISECLEEIAGRRIDREHVSFKKEVSDASKYTVEQLSLKWLPVARSIFALFATRVGDDPLETLSNIDNAKSLALEISGMASAAMLSDKPEFQEFTSLMS